MFFPNRDWGYLFRDNQKKGVVKNLGLFRFVRAVRPQIFVVCYLEQRFYCGKTSFAGITSVVVVAESVGASITGTIDSFPLSL